MYKSITIFFLFITFTACDKTDEPEVEEFACDCERFFIPDEDGFVGSRWIMLRPCEVNLEFETVTAEREYTYISNIKYEIAAMYSERLDCK